MMIYFYLFGAKILPHCLPVGGIPVLLFLNYSCAKGRIQTQRSAAESSLGAEIRCGELSDTRV